MKIPLPADPAIEKASTYQLLLWWCLCPLDPDDSMMVEEEIRERLAENKDHVETLAAATGLAFDG